MVWSCFVLCASMPSRMGSTDSRICVERRVGGTVAVTLIAVEIWSSLWWNDRGQVGSKRGSRVPVNCARSRPSHQREWVPWRGPPWVPVLPEGSTRPSSEAEVRQGVGRSPACVAGVGRGGSRSRQGAGVGRFDDVTGARAKRKAFLSLGRFSG
jgi:hypothetical protein